MDDYLTEQAIRDEAEFQQLLKALSKIDSLRPTWTATSEVKVQKYEDKSHDGIFCSLTFTANDGVTVYLFNQPCHTTCMVRIYKGETTIYQANLKYGRSYERLRDYIEAIANPILQYQEEENRKRLAHEESVRKDFWN